MEGTLVSGDKINAVKPRTLDPQAYELYLKGRYFWNKRTDEGAVKAQEYFQQAVALDPNYAQAYVGLADCYLFGKPPLPRKAAALKTKEMVKNALEIDDSLGEAHATLGLLAENSEWDWASAEKEYKRAIDLNPNYATARQWYGEYLALTGRFDEGMEQMKLAGERDPVSPAILKDTRQLYHFARKYDQAIAYFRKALEIDPRFLLGHTTQTDKAIAVAASAPELAAAQLYRGVVLASKEILPKRKLPSGQRSQPIQRALNASST